MTGTDILFVVLLTVVVLLLALMLGLQMRVAVKLKKMVNRPGEADRPPLPGAMPANVEQQLPEPAEMAFYGSVLRVEMGEDRGQMFKLRQRGSTWIGRDNNVNDIVLTGSSVSRRHSRIESDGRNFFVHDTGSTNGTFVNGQRISTSLLRHGDTITIGSVVFRFLVGPEAGSPQH
ncbi:MAG TPA: FHA domain-containing protein [Acidobacteriota bacterium]|nr:FHA domain-containing protein [Acidobacteriota bacterium]